MILPDDVAARIREIVARGGGLGIDEEARGHGAIALMGTIGEIWMLRPDGTLWMADSDFGLPLTLLPEEFGTMALVFGVGRFPWLAALLPERPADAGDCPKCRGRGVGVVRDSGFRIPCGGCQGLGWLAPPRPLCNS